MGKQLAKKYLSMTSLLPSRDKLILVLIAVLLVSVWILHAKPELLPATLFTFLATVFSYIALRYSRERFRLDLFDKRFEIYSNVLDFCSRVTAFGLRQQVGEDRQKFIETVQIAEKSFRGIGLHKSKALFGEDISSHFNDLNRSYSWLVSFPEPAANQTREQWAEESYRHSTFIFETANRLPELFKPYVYFGDYRRE